MEEDYTGALPHWQAYYDTWTFVHNTRRGVGVPPFITTKLNEFNARNSHILSNHWGCHELEMILLSLDEAKIAGILGWAPSHRTMLGLRAENIAVVLSHIAGRPAGSEVDRSPVPSDKIAANAFSPSTELFLHLGFHKSYMVKRFFDAYYDPSYGDRIASAFREEYRLLRTGGCSPDEIFWRLQKFAGGPTIPETHINEAILAVLAYLFESCDIYERPCSVGAGH